MAGLAVIFNIQYPVSNIQYSIFMFNNINIFQTIFNSIQHLCNTWWYKKLKNSFKVDWQFKLRAAFPFCKMCTIYQLKVDVGSKGKIFRGFNCLSFESYCVKPSKSSQMLKHCSGLSDRWGTSNCLKLYIQKQDMWNYKSLSWFSENYSGPLE